MRFRFKKYKLRRKRKHKQKGKGFWGNAAKSFGKVVNIFGNLKQ